MKWKISELSKQEDGAYRLQVDVLSDQDDHLTRTYVFVAPTMTQSDVSQACSDAALEAYNQDSASREAEASFLGMTGTIITP